MPISATCGAVLGLSVDPKECAACMSQDYLTVFFNCAGSGALGVFTGGVIGWTVGYFGFVGLFLLVECAKAI